MDGYTLKEIPLEILRRDIAYVPQDNFLFSDTIAGNIAFGSEHKTMEDIYDAARKACIHDNIMDFPEQYQTMVGERGVTYSRRSETEKFYCKGSFKRRSNPYLG